MTEPALVSPADLAARWSVRKGAVYLTGASWDPDPPVAKKYSGIDSGTALTPGRTWR